MKKPSKRTPYQIRLSPAVYKQFQKMCDKHGFKIGPRMEIALKNDIKFIKRKFGG